MGGVPATQRKDFCRNKYVKRGAEEGNKKADKAANDARDISMSNKRSTRKKKENLEVGSGIEKNDKNNIC